MVKEIILPQVAEVREIKSEIPSYEEFLKNYKGDKAVENSYENEINANAELGKGYEPCKNTSCGCFCRKEECDCNNPEFSIMRDGSQRMFNGNASGGVGLGGNAVSGDIDFTLFRDSRSNGDLKVGFVTAGAEVVNGFGGAVRASANVGSFKTGGVEIRAGLTFDTAASVSADGVELKLGG
jgi:hypothetical protein